MSSAMNISVGWCYGGCSKATPAPLKHMQVTPCQQPGSTRTSHVSAGDKDRQDCMLCGSSCSSLCCILCDGCMCFEPCCSLFMIISWWPAVGSEAWEDTFVPLVIICSVHVRHLGGPWCWPCCRLAMVSWLVASGRCLVSSNDILACQAVC